MRLPLRRFAAVTGIAVALVLGSSVSASAVGINESGTGAGTSAREDPAVLTATLGASTITNTSVDPSCTAAAATAKVAVDAKFCQVTSTLTKSATTRATAAELAAAGISAAASSGTIWVYTWGEHMRGLTWNEVHGGKTFFDHTYVWGRSLYRGYEGYHTCDIGGSYAYGYVIDVVHCYTTPTRSTYRIQSYDIFKVTAGFHGIPLSYTHSMHVNMYPGGSIYYH